MSVEMQAALNQLSRSERGLNAIAQLLEWLDEGGIELDYRNKLAVVQMLEEAWKNPGSGRDLMRETLKTK